MVSWACEELRRRLGPPIGMLAVERVELGEDTHETFEVFRRTRMHDIEIKRGNRSALQDSGNPSDHDEIDTRLRESLKGDPWI